MSESQSFVQAHPELRRGPILVALLVGSAISLLNETLVNVALTSFMSEFHVPATAVQWLTTGYMLIIGILVPVTAFLLEWLSTKQLFLGALALFSAGTIIAGTAPSFPVLLAGRLVQAVGTGPMVPLMMNTTLLITPPERHGSAMGLCMLVTLAAPALAPVLAGAILEFAGWRWLFFIVLPFAALAAAVAERFLNVPRTLHHPRLDIPSVVLSTVGFGALIYGVSLAGASGISGAALPLGIGGCVLVLFVWRECSIPEPMLNLAPFRYPQFSLGMALVVVMMMGLFADLLLLPMYFQAVLLLSPLAAGLAMLPGGILNGLGAPFSGRLYDRVGPRVVVPAGVFLMGGGLLALSFVVGCATGPLPALVLYAAMMLGMPYAMTPIQTNSLSRLPAEYYSHGTAIMSTLQMIAAAFGSSLFIGLMSSGQAAAGAAGLEPVAALTVGIRGAFRVGACIVACALIGSFCIRGKVHPRKA